MTDGIASQQAVGSLETTGMPGNLAIADAMLKAGRVTLVSYIKGGSARFAICFRGNVSEVQRAMEAGIAVVEKTYGAKLETWVIIPRPHPNVERVLPIGYTANLEEFRLDAV
ncbi:MAG: carbon dioxide-concentrating mechanism protein CcmK [Acaryochloridaceae cyanobacterium SU_2_1]|nr:carbon dioxide-concentrating mechanism protein CcmK [Acaryochloridaceae cyanobacterium SU_2_1]